MKVRYLGLGQNSIFKHSQVVNIYGMALAKDNLGLYLFSTDEGKPHVETIEEFEVCDPSLPPNYFFIQTTSAYTNGHISIEDQLLIGYRELALSPNHFVGLIDDCLNEDLAIFFRNKKAVDEWQKNYDIKNVISYFQDKLTSTQDLEDIDLVENFIKYEENELAFEKLYKISQEITSQAKNAKLNEMLKLLELDNNLDFTKRFIL